MDDRDFELIALRELPGVGERTLARLIALTEGRGEALHSVLDATPARMAAVYDLPAPAITRLCEQRQRHLARCYRLVEDLRTTGVRILRRGREDFPARLERELTPPPPLLFAFGNLSMLTLPCVAILASREIEDETVPATVSVLRKAREERLAVAIGGMKTHHRIAAISARAIGTERIVVLDRGLFAAFGADLTRDPFGCGNRPTRLDAATLVLSPHRPEDHAAPNNGRRRDEMIAAFGDLVFASSARPNGEVERICRAALQRGKPVYVWRGANAGLMAAGARALSPDSLAGGLRRLLASRPRATARRGWPADPPPRASGKRRSHAG